jgi:ATP phosphoribosyltransferase
LRRPWNFLKIRASLRRPLRREEGFRLRIGDYEFLLVKPFDVPVYVENGVADLGVVGYDVLLEREPEVYELYNLGIGFCRLVIAGKEERLEQYKKASFLRVATKYPKITREFFLEKGIKTKVIYLNGSVELAPLLNLADVIMDLVQTGRTLKENNLVVFEEISPSTARLICNRASYRNKKDEIFSFLSKVQEERPKKAIQPHPRAT